MDEEIADSGEVESVESTEESGVDMQAAMDDITQSIFSKKEEADVSTQPEEAPEEVEVQAEASEVVEEEVKQPPQSWKKDMHESWKTIPPEVQEYIEQRENQMKDGLEKDRGDANLGRVMRDVMSPYSEMLKSQNIDESVMVRNLMNAHYKMSTADESGRVQLLNQLAQSYGVNLDGSQPQQIDPALKSVQDKVNQLESHLTASHQRALQESRARVESDVEKFASEHEFFDDVAEQIVPLINAGYELEDAYQNAIWLNPVTRQKEIDRASHEAATKAQEEAKREAEKARKAKSTNVRGRDTSKSPTEPTGTMEDTMRETFRNIQSRSN